MTVRFVIPLRDAARPRGGSVSSSRPAPARVQAGLPPRAGPAWGPIAPGCQRPQAAIRHPHHRRNRPRRPAPLDAPGAKAAGRGPPAIPDRFDPCPFRRGGPDLSRVGTEIDSRVSGPAEVGPTGLERRETRKISYEIGHRRARKNPGGLSGVSNERADAPSATGGHLWVRPGHFVALLQDSPSSASFFSLITGHLGASSAFNCVNSFHSSGRLSS
jgi:hypothetical protein